jgi:ketosteroid isomerase-like protein
MPSPRATVEQFHDHFNARRRDEVMALAADDFALGGARGTGAGTQLLEEWVGRATTTMRPRRWFAEGDTVVVEEQVEWRTRDGGRVTDSTIWGLAFTVRDGKIASLARYANIGEAVTSTGLDETHEIGTP